MKKELENNKGFSLVELIIVLAIMAVLVAVIAPMLLKYFEKSKVTSDKALLNTISAAVTYASVDRKVVDDTASEAFLNSFVSTPVMLEDIPTNTVLYTEVLDTLGWTDLSQATYMNFIRSAHTGNSHIYMQYKGSADNPISFWITCTDAAGDKDTSENETGNYQNVNTCIIIK